MLADEGRKLQHTKPYLSVFCVGYARRRKHNLHAQTSVSQTSRKCLRQALTPLILARRQSRRRKSETLHLSCLR